MKKKIFLSALLLIFGLFLLGVIKAKAQPSRQVLLNVNYENGTISSGIQNVTGTHATAPDAVYMVSPAGNGSNYAIAHKIVYGDPSYKSDGDIYRSESDAVAVPNARYFPGDERRYEFSVMLKDWTPWVSGDTFETTIYQLKISGNAATDSGVPLQFRTARNRLRLRYVNSTSATTIIEDLRPLVNQWLHFRIDVLWADSNTGYMRTYMKLPGESSYTMVDEKVNYHTFAGDVSVGNIGYIKWGAYVTQQGLTRIVYHDDIRIINLNQPPLTTGLIWGNAILDANPAYLDGPYTREPNFNNPATYDSNSNVYIHPYIKYTPSQNIVYPNSTSPVPNVADNVIGTPYSDFSRATLTAGGGSSAVPGPGGRYLLGGWNAAQSPSIPTPFDPAEYYEFKLEPEDGYYLKFTDIKFRVNRGNTNSAGKFSLRSSADNFAADIGVPYTMDGTLILENISFDASSLSNVNTPITFRLYAYGATTSTSAVGIYNYEFYGQVLPSTMPVQFVGLSAKYLSSNINLSWITASEKNNSYFEIQTSLNGKDFTTVKTVQSRNGNSSTTQNYDAVIGISTIPNLMALPLLLGFFGFVTIKKQKRANLIFGLFFLVVVVFSCRKQESSPEKSQANIYIRIKQVDLNGEFTYSEVVQVKMQ